MQPTIYLVATGVANMASVAAAFGRLGCRVVPTQDPEVVRKAMAVVLPGVGAFGPAANQLRLTGLDAVLRERVAQDRPLLGICLGMQLLASGSEESPDAAGLGVFGGRAQRYVATAGLRVPQFGWNRVEAAGCASPLDESGYAYFANSYRLLEAAAGWDVAWAEHGGRFVAAVARGAIVGCQFHPELSAGFGQRLLARWVDRAKARVGMSQEVSP